MRFVLRFLIRGYQLAISPLFGPRCRFYPSCSQYALDAFRIHGLFKGAAFAGWRILRCNPWSHGGVDRAEDAHFGRHKTEHPA